MNPLFFLIFSLLVPSILPTETYSTPSECDNWQNETAVLFQIYDATGKLQMTEKISSTDQQVKLDFIPNGLVFYRFIDSNGIVLDQGRLIKQ